MDSIPTALTQRFFPVHHCKSSDSPPLIFRCSTWTLGHLDSWTLGQLGTWTVGLLDGGVFYFRSKLLTSKLVAGMERGHVIQVSYKNRTFNLLLPPFHCPSLHGHIIFIFHGGASTRPRFPAPTLPFNRRLQRKWNLLCSKMPVQWPPGTVDKKVQNVCQKVEKWIVIYFAKNASKTRDIHLMTYVYLQLCSRKSYFVFVIGLLNLCLMHSRILNKLKN